MLVKVLSAAPLNSAAGTSSNHHVHITNGAIPTAVSVSSGLSNEQTLVFRDGRRNDVPIETRDTRIFINGTFGSGSASGVVAIDLGISGSYINLFSVSAPFTSVVPLQVGQVVRFRYHRTSAIAATAVTGASLDCWIG